MPAGPYSFFLNACFNLKIDPDHHFSFPLVDKPIGQLAC